MNWQVLSCKKVEWQHLLHFGNTLGRQDIPKRRWVLTLVASFRLSVPSSLSVFLPVTPVCVGKEGRQVLSCKKMGWKLWPELIIVSYTVPYCTTRRYCTTPYHAGTVRGGNHTGHFLCSPSASLHITASFSTFRIQNMLWFFKISVLNIALC